MIGLQGRNGNSRQLCMYRLIEPNETVVDSLPSGYEYAEYDDCFDEKWISLINASGDFTGLGIWTKDTLYTTIIEQLIPYGAVLVNWNGELIATLSLCRSVQDVNFAVIMYALVSYDHRGRGLGDIMTQRAIQICQKNGIKEVRLLTDDYRMAAIKMYLRNGFLPVTENRRELEERWRKIFEQLK
jgi:mycothiol synthase